jgi:hypothetical protein
MTGCAVARATSVRSGVQAAIVACALAACASIDATTLQYVGAPTFAATDPAKVQILRTEPTKPHDKLGEIDIDASIDPAPPIAQIEEKLRTEGAKMGADAVVVVLDRVSVVGVALMGPYWGRSAQTIDGRRVVGIAIHYR